MADFVREVEMNCDIVMDLIDELVESNEGFESRKNEIEKHISQCDKCEKYYKMTMKLNSIEDVSESLDLWTAFVDIAEKREKKRVWYTPIKWSVSMIGTALALFIGLGYLMSPMDNADNVAEYNDLFSSYVNIAVEDEYQLDDDADVFDYYFALSMNY